MKARIVGKIVLGCLLAISIFAQAASAESQLSYAARLVIPGHALIVGVNDTAADASLNCAKPAVQHTMLSCTLPASVLPQTTSLGRPIESAALSVHFQGQIVNMSVVFSAGNSADDVISQLQAAFGKKPTVQYWADDAHLYASSIWVDGQTEVEVTKTIKGDAGDGKVRMYVSSLTGGLPINPEDSL